MKNPTPEATPLSTRNLACIYVAAAAAFLGLAFFHLDGRLLWGDEAETATLAKNMLEYGAPQADDGDNNITLYGSQVDANADGVWTWSPWLQEFVAARSFALFGPTTWAARAPFTLIGWVDVICTGLLAWNIFRSHRVALFSMALLGTSEIFLLHIRQCRYYSISVGGEILLAYGVVEIIRQRQRGMWLAGLALILQFYSNYIVAAANVPALLALGWRLGHKGWRPVLYVGGVFVILAVAAIPWLAYAHSLSQTNSMGGENYGRKFLTYLYDFNFYFLPVAWFLLPLGAALLGRRRQEEAGPEAPRAWEAYALTLLPLYFGAALAAPGIYPRYLLPLLPVACILMAVWAARIQWRALAAGLVAVQSSSNIFAAVPAYPLVHSTVRFPLIEYAHSLTAPYADRFADVLQYLQANAQPGQTLMTDDPEFPTIFYTRLKIINATQMKADPPRLPDWILPQSASGVVNLPPFKLSSYMLPHYERIVLTVHQSPRLGSYPDPHYFQYRSTTNREDFVIYKLKR